MLRGYLFGIFIELKKRNLECDVIAPSLIPVIPGERVKTNRLDSEKLSEYYSKGQLTVVHVPNEEEETVRDLLRGRRFSTDQRKRQKQFILSLCRRMGWDYRSESSEVSFWTTKHLLWLRGKVRDSQFSALKYNLGSCLDQFTNLMEQIKNYDLEIERIAKEPFYQKRVEALCCFRGIDTISAMTLITEIADASRFAHPSKLTSYAGMDLCEYSSGKTKRWGITKMGNKYIRTTSVEASQSAWRRPQVSSRLKKKRLNAEPQFIDIADRCMKRLHKKSTRLLYAGKEKNKIKVACARELLCFVWEALKVAA